MAEHARYYNLHLHQRWNEGCTNIQQLHREVKALGFRGSYATVYAYLAPFQGKAAPPAVPDRPRFVTSPSWIVRRPTTSTPASSSSSSRCARPARTWTPCAGHVEEFAKMLTGRHGERLDAWIAAVRADDSPHGNFANGLERDHAAVLAGLTSPYDLALSKANSARSNI